MSTFYLLPPRPHLARRFTAFLAAWFPGLNWQGSGCADLIEGLAETASRHPDVFVVHREDLPEGEEPIRALIDGFGAEAGDEVIELVSGPEGDPVTSRRWRLPVNGASGAA
jgi:hypothetical protein